MMRPSLLVGAYLALMPFLAGLPRDGAVPVLRPSEALQFAITTAAAAVAITWLWRGAKVEARPGRFDWWLLAMVTAASLLPLLWLMARAEPVGQAELLAVFPLIKYGTLYLLARTAVRSESDVRLVITAALGAAGVIAAIAIAQSLGVSPVTDVLGRFFVSSDADIVDEARGTTTIGSSIATGGYLSIAATLALSVAFITSRVRWFVAAGFLAVGALASGQAGTVVALAVALVVVSRLHNHHRQMLRWSLPLAVLAGFALWPLVGARLADIDQGSGLPQSWVIRWVNITELYWPRLANGGWLFGVSPDATLVPPDIWRDIVYLESGYLWLLWVGGLPLLIAAAAFMISACRHLGQADRELGANAPTEVATIAAGRAGRAAIVMLAVVSLLDPHLTLRAEADLFFVLLALGAARPLTGAAFPHHQWQSLLGGWLVGLNAVDDRLRMAEATPPASLAASLPPSMKAESGMTVTVQRDDRTVAEAHLALVRQGRELHGVIHGPILSVDEAAGALLWRALALSAGSLRLRSLERLDTTGQSGPQNQLGDVAAGRGELRSAARLAGQLELRRAARTTVGARASDRRTPLGSVLDPDAGPGSLPAIRLELGYRPPRWKRIADIVIGVTAGLATAPLLVLSAIVVRLSSPGPVIFRQVRVGTGGLPFQMYKFRTMYIDNDDTAHREQNRLEVLGLAAGSKDSNDSRVTGIGRWLRRLSLDELPQLLNVARSEMSLVGPRPSLLWEVELYEPTMRKRLAVRPGLTGLWQTSGRGAVSMIEMLQLDLEYVETMSPAVDLRCLVGTARSVVGGKGAA